MCPYEKAWVDTAIAVDDAHNYARCANKGECDGKSGQCKCWEPFGGKGCRRMECPNACSGHGTCEYISELAASNKCDWDTAAYAAKTNCVHASIPTYSATAISYGAKHASTDVPSVWDAWKIQGCQCDPFFALRVPPEWAFIIARINVVVFSTFTMMLVPVEGPGGALALAQAVKHIFVHRPLHDVGIGEAERYSDHGAFSVFPEETRLQNAILISHYLKSHVKDHFQNHTIWRQKRPGSPPWKGGR